MSSNESEATPATPRTGSRVAHLLHVAPFDRVAFAAALSSTAARLEPLVLGALVLVPDRATASAAAEVLLSLVDPSVGAEVRVLAVTAPTRAARLIASEQPSAIVATPVDAVAIVRTASLTLGAIPSLTILGLDVLLAEPALADAMTALLTDEPGQGARVALTSARSEAVDAFVERHLFKAREVGVAQASALGQAIEVVACTDQQIDSTVIALLDEIDPPGAVLMGAAGPRLTRAAEALRAAGYRLDSGTVRLETVDDAREDDPTPAALQLLLEVPASPERLRRLLAHEGARTVVLAAPSDIPRLSRYAGGAVTRLVPAARRAGLRTHIDGVRQALQRELETAPSAAEFALVEPLVGRHDDGAVAAVAVRLLEKSWRELAAAKAELAAARFAPRVAESRPAESREADAATDRGARRERPTRSEGFAPRGDRPTRGPRDFGDRPRERSFGDRPRGDRPFRDRPPREERSFSDRPRGERPFSDRPPRQDRPFGDRPRGERPSGERSFGDRPRGDRPYGERSFRDRPPREGRDGPPRGRGGPPGERDAREWSARAPRERTEQRGEWAERGDRLARSKRPVRPRGEADRA